MLPDERKAVAAMDKCNAGCTYEQCDACVSWQTIRAHLLAREAEVERLTEDRDSQQRAAIAALDRAERAEATLREIRDSTHKSALMLRAMADRCITAHLPENSRGSD